MSKRCLQMSIRAALVGVVGVSWGVASAPQA